MRVTSMLAGLSFVLAACGGGEQKAGEQQTTTTSDQAAPAGEAAPAGGGATHDVNMVLEGSSYKFVPDQLTIKSGDVVRFHNVSGGPHNVSFWADSIPSGAADALKAGIRAGAAPADLGRSLAYGAALRVARFGTANEHADWETAHHVFTFANAVHQMLNRIGTASTDRVCRATSQPIAARFKPKKIDPTTRGESNVWLLARSNTASTSGYSGGKCVTGTSCPLPACVTEPRPAPRLRGPST